MEQKQETVQEKKITKSSTKTLEAAATTSMETQQSDRRQTGPIQQPPAAAVTRVDAVELGITKPPPSPTAVAAVAEKIIDSVKIFKKSRMAAEEMVKKMSISEIETPIVNEMEECLVIKARELKEEAKHIAAITDEKMVEKKIKTVAEIFGEGIIETATELVVESNKIPPIKIKMAKEAEEDAVKRTAEAIACVVVYQLAVLTDEVNASIKCDIMLDKKIRVQQ